MYGHTERSNTIYNMLNHLKECFFYAAGFWIFGRHKILCVPWASLLQKVWAHMKLKDVPICSTQAHREALITEHWVTFHLDLPNRNDFVNHNAGKRQFCSYSARGLTHSTAIFFTSTQLPMRRFEQKLQRRAICN